MPDDQIQDPLPLPKGLTVKKTDAPLPLPAGLTPISKKKDTGGNSVEPSIVQYTLPEPVISPSPLPVKNKPSFDPFDTASLFTTPTVKNLDPVELRDFNSQLPGLVTPEKQTEVVKSIIEKRKNPAVKISNAQAFISDDIANNVPPGVNDAFGIETYKQKITTGAGADESINLPSYFSKRNSDLDTQIKALKDQQYVAGSGGRGGQYADEVKAGNFDELQTKIDNLSLYQSHLNNYAGTLAAYQASNSVPVPTDKNPNTMKDYYRKVGLQIGKVTSPIATSIKENQIATSLDANRHPELVDIENYRLESEGLAARQFSINADFNNGKLKPEEYNSQLNEIQAQRQKLFDLHPQAKKVAQAQAIGQIIQQERDAKPFLPGNAIVSAFNNIVNYHVKDDEIKSAAQKLGLTEDEVKTQINNRDDIPGTSFLANVYNKFIVSSGETIVSPILSLVTKGRLRTDEEVESEKYANSQLFQFNASQAPSQPNAVINTDAKRGTDEYLQEVANPAAGHHNYGTGTLNAVGDALGTLGQLWLATELTGGLSDVAVGGVVGTEVAGVARTASALKEVKQLSAAQKALMGNMAGMVVTGYNDNKAAAKQFLPDEKSQQVYALTRSLETGLLFGLLGGGPQKLIANIAGKAESEAAVKTFAEMIPAEGIEALGQKEWGDYLKNNLAAKIGADALKENAKATALMTLDEAVGIGTQAMFNPQSVDSKNLGHDLLNSAVHNFLTFAPISFFGAAVKGGHADQSAVEKEALYRMGQDPAQYADYVNEQVKNGMPQADADRRIQLVNSMGKIIQSGDVPANLSRSEKIEFANNLLHEKKLYSEINNLSSKPLIELKDSEIKGLQERQKQILLNSDGIEKDVAGIPIIRSNEIIQNETANNSDQGTQVANNKTAQNTALVGDGAQTKVATDQVGISVEKLLDPHRDKLVLSEFPTDEQKIKFIAEQAQNVSPNGEKAPGDSAYNSTVSAFGEPLVKKAIEMFPEEKLLSSAIPPEDNIRVAELIDHPVTYNGQRGSLYLDGKAVIFKVDGQAKEFELGNVNEVGGLPIKDLGIGQEKSVVNVNEAGNFVVRDGEFQNNFSDPTKAINYDKEGNIVSVNLESIDGKKRTFRGNVAEDLAYQIHLKEITKDNESRKQFEQFINEQPDISKEINDAAVSETTTQQAVGDNAPISGEKGQQIKSPQDQIADLQKERDAKLSELSRPEVSLNFIPDEKLVKIKAALNNKHLEIEDKFEKLKSLIDCIWKTR